MLRGLNYAIGVHSMLQIQQVSVTFTAKVVGSGLSSPLLVSKAFRRPAVYSRYLLRIHSTRKLRIYPPRTSESRRFFCAWWCLLGAAAIIAGVTSLENFRLTVFRKVAEQLSFRKAAEELYLTQPAISLQVKALEEELGVILFDRSGSHVRLTPAGESLLRYATESSRLLHEARHAVASFSGTQTGGLALGASTTIAQYVLPRLLSEFCTSHPRVHPTLISGNTEQIVMAVDEEKIALGFIEGPPRSRHLAVAPFLEDELVLLAPAAHQWAEQKEIALAELVSAPLLMRERGSGTRHIIELVLERRHIRRNSLNVVMELDSTEAIKSAVEAGFGVGFVSRWAIAKDVRLGPAFHIVEIKGMRFHRHFTMIYPKGPDLAGPAAEFRGFVLAKTARRGLTSQEDRLHLPGADNSGSAGKK